MANGSRPSARSCAGQAEPAAHGIGSMLGGQLASALVPANTGAKSNDPSAADLAAAKMNKIYQPGDPQYVARPQYAQKPNLPAGYNPFTYGMQPTGTLLR